MEPESDFRKLSFALRELVEQIRREDANDESGDKAA